ncbi:ABC transporter substrate-binding protein [Aliidiomarina sp.]|uniref:ABC transporter substrate-binding protein n=1 Tax=Aliidiomarina sp. TaxID=1872439 RepID=UPI003A4D4C8F
MRVFQYGLVLVMLCTSFTTAAVNAVAEQDAVAKNWQEITAEARGQTVYFHGWGGSAEANRYMRWAAAELLEEYGVRLRHVRVADISESVSLLLNEQASQGDDYRSAVDLIWINGKNFHALKEAGLLTADLSTQIPNSALLNPEHVYEFDFGVATEDLELPWGVAQFYLMLSERAQTALLGATEADTQGGTQVHEMQARVSAEQLLAFAKTNTGRVSYPKPPEFHGTTFLKQLLLALNSPELKENSPELRENSPEQNNVRVEALYEEYNAERHAPILAALFNYLDQLHPHLWREGRAFPNSAAEQMRMFADGQLDIAVSFNPGALASGVQRGTIPAVTMPANLGAEAITNSHYLAIPKHSEQRAGALVTLNFLLSETAQRHKANPDIWGDPAAIVLPYSQVESTQVESTQVESSEVGNSPAGLLFPAAQEPHVSWNAALEQAWRERYE